MADVAWTGASYLVVWQDARNGRDIDLWGASLSSNGRTPLLANRPLAQSPGDQTLPAISASGSALLVVWLDRRTCGSEVMAQVYSFDFAPLSSVIQVTTSACTTQRPAVAWNSSAMEWLVTWGGHGSGREVHGALVSSTGTTSVSDFRIAGAANSASTPSVTPFGSDFLVAFADDRLALNRPAIYATTVSATGTVGLELQLSSSAVAQTTPCAVDDFQTALVAWSEGGSIFVQRVLAGPSLGAPPVQIATGTLAAPACLMTESGPLVLYENRALGSGVYAQPLGMGEAPLGELAVLPRQGYFDRSAPRVARGVSTALVVAHGPTSFVQADDIVAKTILLGATTAVSDAGVTRLSSGASSVQRVSAAFDGQRYLAVWRDNGRVTGGSEVTGQLLDPATGRWLGPDAGLYLATNTANLSSYPVVAAGDGGFLVAWGNDGSAGQLKGSVVTSNGVARAPRLLSDVSAYVDNHRLRWLGDACLSVFQRRSVLSARRTLASGATAQAETALAQTGGAPESFDVAVLSDEALVAYLVRDGGPASIAALRLDLDGGLLDPVPQLIDSPGEPDELALAANGAEFQLVWTIDAGAGLERIILASTVDRAGLAARPIVVGRGRQPAVEWTGYSWLVVFRQSDDLFGGRVRNGALLDQTPIVVANSGELERKPSVAAGPLGQMLITWDAYVGDASTWNFGAFGRFFWDQRVAADAGGDAGAVDDAGVDAGADAGGVDDAGVDGGLVSEQLLQVGCGCSGEAAVAWVLALAALTRRRSGYGSSSRARRALGDVALKSKRE